MSKGNENEQQITIAPEREKFMNDLVADLKAEGMPDDMAHIFGVQTDTCYLCFLMGNAVAKRLVAEGEIEEERRFEVAMDFARILTQKITIKQQPSQLAAPGPVILSSVPPGVRH